jgi:hypothetical protein
MEDRISGPDESWIKAWEDANGFFGSSLDVHINDEGLYDRGGRSTIWSGHSYPKADGAEEKVAQLRRIRDAVAGLIRVHGVLKGTSVEVAGVGSEAAACAGFKNPRKFTSPYILIGKSIMGLVSNEDDLLDVYCGLGLHEASHINHTRLAYKYKVDGSLINGARLWSELLEDERIEDKIRSESPGFTQYLVATKKALFDDQEVGGFFKSWELGSDRDKLTALFFAFVRTPYLLTDEHKAWRTVDDRSPYDELSILLNRRPHSEEYVLARANDMQKLFESFSETYDDFDKAACEKIEGVESMGPPEPSSEDGEGSSPPKKTDGEIAEDIEKALDKLLEDMVPKDLSEEESEDWKKSVEYSFQKSRGSDGTPRLDPPTMPPLTDSEMSRAIENEDLSSLVLEDKKSSDELKKHDDILRSRGMRASFGRVEIERMQRRMEVIEGALSTRESKVLESCDRDRVTTLGIFDAGDYSSRRTVIKFPRGDKETRERYHRWKNEVRSQIAQMRKVFRFKRSAETRHLNEQREGALHRRKLSHVRASDRLFRSTYKTRGMGVHLSLLLDESGSMGNVQSSTSKSKSTALAATCIAEGVKNAPGVRLDVYSHTSCGNLNKDCVVSCLSSPENPSIESIGCFDPGKENYDHRAIEVVADRMKDSKIKGVNDEDVARVLIVLSDGEPAGRGYGGSSARKQTREVVKKVTRGGTTVINVAIGGYGDSEDMFDHVIQFENLKSLTRDMRKLIQRVVR